MTETGPEARLPDPVTEVRQIIDGNAYLTMATVGGDGRPWASPVWFAHRGHTEFLWVSRPTARHSRNLATNPRVGIVVFDSRVPAGQGRAVYADATAARLDPAEAEEELSTYSTRSIAHGVGPWTRADVEPPAPFGLYRAVASRLYVLLDTDERAPVDPEALGGR